MFRRSLCFGDPVSKALGCSADVDQLSKLHGTAFVAVGCASDT